MLYVYNSHISSIYSPQKALVIWFSGCSIKCKGCWNKHMWNKTSGKKTTFQNLLNEVKTQIKENDIKDVVLIGGEPIEQDFTSIKNFIKGVKQLDLGVILNSGYTLQQINKTSLRSNILSLCDIAVTGRYNHNMRDTSLQWRGSTNQKINYISSRYNEKSVDNVPTIEIKCNDDGSMTVLGYPDFLLDL